MSSAADRRWGPGYPTPRNADMVKVTNGGEVAVWVHRAISPIVAYLFKETERRGYHLRPGQCWGYANRAIRGGKAPSNHSWGLAVDINAPANPMAGRLITDMPAWMPALWKDYGFGWGGDYRRRKDAMHYEFLGTPTDAIFQANRVAGLVPTAPPASKPGGGGEPVLRLNSRGPAVERLQTMLRDHCSQDIGRIDGHFGQRTLRAVLAVQRFFGLKDDGVVGEQTWALLYFASRRLVPA